MAARESAPSAGRQHYTARQSMFPLEGGCACGHTRYRLEAAPLIVHCCHCTLCQRETGTAFALNALVESDKVTRLGPAKVTVPPGSGRPAECLPCGPALDPAGDGTPQSIKTPSQSGFGQTIVRCPTCATAVWSHYAGAGPVLAFIRVGTLDRAWEIAPDVHIYTASQRDFVFISDGKPQFQGFYPSRDALYRKDALERYAQVEGDIVKFREERNRLGPEF